MKTRIFAVTMLAILFVSSRAFAQTGTIEGTVSDKTGAVVQAAEITVTNLETKATRAVSSGGTGSYSMPNLPVGRYEIVVKKEGFRSFKVAEAVLTVDQVLTANAQLEPGAVSEEVQVLGSELPPVDLETAQISNLVDSKQMLDLPLITRDPYSLVLLSPGTSQTNTSMGGFSVNGGRDRNNNFLLDGVDNNDTSVPGIPDGLVAANPDSTEEFRVITDNFNPEYGRNTGAIIDVVTKSGTNTFHGGAREFGRWNSFGGARDWFNPRVDPASGQLNPMNPYVRNQFGFNIGGPIIKNKTFFFVDSEWQRFRTTLTNTSVVPNAAFKSMFNGGTFPYTDNDPNDCPGGTAPCTLQIDAGGANSNLGLGVDPLMKQVLSLYPDPNGPAVDQFRGNLFYPSTSKFDARNITAKIDHHFTDNEVLTIHGAYDELKDPDAFHDEFLPGIGATATQSHVLLAGATLTSTLRPTLVNEVKMGFNKNDNPFTCGNLNTLNVGSVDQYGRSRDFSLPDIAGFGCLPLGDSNGQWRKTGTWSIGESLSWVKGPHTFKFGADYRRVYENGYDSFTSRSFVTLAPFSNIGLSTVSVNPALPPCDPFGFLGGPANANDPYQNCGELNDGFQGTPDATPDNVFQDMANVVVGLMDSEQQSQFFDKAGTRTQNDSRQFRQHEYDFYFQDSWKIRQSLTINIGLRYQFNGVPFETGNNLSNLFQNSSGPAPAVDPSNCGGATPCNGFTFSLVGPGTGHLLYNNDFTNFEPRIGFAWDPFKDGKTSIRGAFGTFHDRVFGNLFG